MYSEVYSVTLAGLDARIVKVETDAGDGLPSFEMSGCLAAQVTEAKERVRVAIKNSGIVLRPQKITVNISPADIRKAGNGFDLPVAVGILAADGFITTDELDKIIVIGELSLDGRINGVKGIVNCVAKAAEMGFKKCIIPYCNICEGNLIGNIEVLGADSLGQVVGYFNGKEELVYAKKSSLYNTCEKSFAPQKDFSDIAGQSAAKRASLIAAAGRHNICFIGVPGTGKTMMASRISTVMPPLEEWEKTELTRIYSAAGKLDAKGFVGERPFRSPNHNATRAAMLGGGAVPSPGEITLAHKGILFLDEFNEFLPNVIDSLRTPLEEHAVRIIRGTKEYIYPADFMLVAAMNPCKCGYYPDRNRCTCSDYEIKRYMGRVSKPIWDRIDICTHMGMIDVKDILYGYTEENLDNKDVYTSENMRNRVEKAYCIQKERFKNENIEFNSQMNERQVKKYCNLGKEEKKLLELAFERLNITVRGYHKILKTARTVADIEGEENINARHISEAVSYRS